MKTILLTFNYTIEGPDGGHGLRAVGNMLNEHVVSLGDAILKTKEFYPKLKITDIIAVSTIDGDTAVPYVFSNNELARQKSAEQIDNYLSEAFRLLRDGNKIVRERDTHDHTQGLELDINELYPRPDQCNRPACDCVEVAEHLNGGNPVKQYQCRAKCNDLAAEKANTNTEAFKQKLQNFTKHFDANP